MDAMVRSVVLLVDNDLVRRAAFSARLATDGYSVLEVDDPWQAFLTLAQGHALPPPQIVHIAGDQRDVSVDWLIDWIGRNPWLSGMRVVRSGTEGADEPLSNAEASVADGREQVFEVAIVEEDVGVCALIREILSVNGYRSLVARTPAAFQRQLASHRPTVLLVDLDSGDWGERLAFCQQVKAGGAVPVVLAVSAQLDEALLDDVSRAGVDGFLPKPFSPIRLLGMIDAVRAWTLAPASPLPDLWFPGLRG